MANCTDLCEQCMKLQGFFALVDSLPPSHTSFCLKQPKNLKMSLSLSDRVRFCGKTYIWPNLGQNRTKWHKNWHFHFYPNIGSSKNAWEYTDFAENWYIFNTHYWTPCGLAGSVLWIQVCACFRQCVRASVMQISWNWLFFFLLNILHEVRVIEA